MACCGKRRKKFQKSVAKAKYSTVPKRKPKSKPKLILTVPISRSQRIKKRQARIKQRNMRIEARKLRIEARNKRASNKNPS